MVVAGCTVYGRAQDVAFEVASVKAGSGEFSTRPTIMGNRFEWAKQVAYLIGYAYDVEFSRVEATPDVSAVRLERQKGLVGWVVVDYLEAFSANSVGSGLILRRSPELSSGGDQLCKV